MTKADKLLYKLPYIPLLQAGVPVCEWADFCNSFISLDLSCLREQFVGI